MASSNNSATIQVVPGWVRTAAIVTLVLASLLLALGGFVTSFRAGMADPVWPTEPWYLVNNFKLDLGYLVEHIHRIMGWIVGASVTVLAFGAWIYEPRKPLQIGMLIALALLIVSYGEFHRGMGKVWNERKEKAATEYQLDPKQPDYEAKIATLPIPSSQPWPYGSGIATGVLAFGILAVSAMCCGNLPGGMARAAAAWGLIFVMAQGLLGGFRVYLNALMGTNLALIHGAFGQIAFCVLIAAVILAAPRTQGDHLPQANREKLLPLSWAVVALLILQLIWAVILRHTGTGLSQRLHILTAFAVTGLTVWLAIRLLNLPAPNRYRGQAIHLLGILGVQLLFGVEAYIGKFASTGPYALTLPELRPTTTGQAAVRTFHQLVGAGLLGSAVAITLRLARKPLPIEAKVDEKSYEIAAETIDMP